MSEMLTNLQLWNALRKKFPNFASHTAEGTKDLFTDRGFEALRLSDIDAINEYYNLSMRVAFQKIDIAKVKDPLASVGLVEIYNTPNGGFTQRIAINSIKPISPKYLGLKTGDSVDMQTVRKESSSERFFQMNYNYQSTISIEDFQIKTLFLDEYGVSSYIAGIMRGLENGYTVQNYVNTLETLNAGLNSTKYPLQDSQKYEVSWTDEPTVDNLKDFILTINDIATVMDTTASTSAFNAMGFDTAYDKSDFIVLGRAGIKNRIKMLNKLQAPGDTSIPFEYSEVEHFGGLVPKDANDADMQEVYDSFGTVVGYIDGSVTVNGHAFQNSVGQWLVNVTSGSTTADTTFPTEPDHWHDPNADIIAVIAQKGLIFKNQQNPYQVAPAPHNVAGLYTTFWASSPNNGIVYDPLYGCIVIKKAANTEDDTDNG